MAIFKEEHRDAIERGVKTQTRRVHSHPWKVGRVYHVKRDWYHNDEDNLQILITGRRMERLGDITPEDALKEGGYSVEEYMEVWRKINGSWDPDQEVWVYEFQLAYQTRLFLNLI